jgi:catechol 2,3-dioxygenase-like lactoylglutathione lyase family enzyme
VSGPGLEIVKPAIDIGVQTNDLDAHQAFWGDELGLRFDHLLKVGGGVHQHRYDLHGGVLKLNAHRDPLPAEAPTGYTAIAVVDPVRAGDGIQGRAGPDGLRVALTPPTQDQTMVNVMVEASDVARTLDVLEATFGGSRAEGTLRIGETKLSVKLRRDRRPTEGRDGLGIRYLTVQVRDVDAAHAHALASGMAEGVAPLRLGDVARISFVRLPDGDWIELSQRASLTGSLDERPGAG